MATVTRENIGLLNDRITVKVSGEDYLPAFEKALKNYSKSANIPGFRKGMVPAGLIRKMHGQGVFADEVLRTVERQLNEYLSAEQVEIFAQPLPVEEATPQLDHNSPSEYDFSFEIGLKPSFEVTNLGAGVFTRYVINITDAMIEEEVSRLQLRHGNLTDQSEVSSDNNVVNVHFTELAADGSEVEGGVQKDNSLLVKYFSEATRPALMGKKAEDALTVVLKEAFEEKELEWILNDLGLTADAADKTFRVTITKVSLMEPAALDQTFFDQVYPGKEITAEDAFKGAIRSEMENYWAAQTRNQLHDQIFHALVDDTKIDLPEQFLKRWIQVSGEKKKSAEEAEAEFPTFKNQLKWTLIVDQIVRDNNIEVVPEDLKAFAKQQLFSYMGGMGMQDENQPWIEDYVNRMMKDKKFVEDSFHRIQSEKVFNWAEQQVNPVEQSIEADAFTKMVQSHKH
jgi:trigger factor